MKKFNFFQEISKLNIRLFEQQNFSEVFEDLQSFFKEKTLYNMFYKECEATKLLGQLKNKMSKTYQIRILIRK